MQNLISLWQTLTARLRGVGESLPPLVLRLIMGWEFWESGWEKYSGDNWFADIQSRFPFPFSAIPADISWTLATYLEIGGAVLLLLGLFTRFAAYSLIVLTFVATAAVHWPDMISMWSDLAKGYAITDMGHGNFKLPLLFVVMLLPIVFSGPGKISLDHLLARALRAGPAALPLNDAYAWALASLALAIPFLLLTPLFGATLLLVAAALFVFGRFART